MTAELSRRDLVGPDQVCAREWRRFDHECTNPFATRWTRPGAIAFDSTDGWMVGDLLQRFLQSDCRGEIVGPHGSGKSTLLATLVPALETIGRKVVVSRLHDGGRRLPLARRELAALDRTAVLAIDGYEQLGRLQRWRLRARRRRQGFGLIVTSHEPVGLPLLYRTRADVDLVERLIERQLPPHEGRITPADVARAWRRNPGNVREVFFELYDVFEQRRVTCVGAERLEARSNLSITAGGL